MHCVLGLEMGCASQGQYIAPRNLNFGTKKTAPHAKFLDFFQYRNAGYCPQNRKNYEFCP